LAVDTEATIHVGDATAEGLELKQLESQLFSEEVQALFKRGFLPYLTNYINAALLVAALWSLAPHRNAILWMIAVYFLTSVRLLLYYRYWKSPDRLQQPRRWVLLYTLGTACNGLTWGSAAVLLYTPDQIAGQVIIAFVLGGMAAGSTATAGAYQPAFRLFAVLALAPIAVRFYASGNRVHIGMAIMLFIFGLAMDRLAFWTGNALKSAIVLRLRNEGLLKKLVRAHSELSQLNKTLEERIAERTQEIEKSRAALQKAVDARDEFLNIAAHELRNPLTALQLRAESKVRKLRKAGMSQQELQSLAADDERHVKEVVHLVENMLDASRMDRPGWTVQPTLCDLIPLIHQSLERFTPELERASCAVTTDLPPRLVGKFDPQRLEQVLRNLWTNALKYGGGRSISIAATMEPGTAVIRVTDQGRGIAPRDLSRIFEKYERVGDRAAESGLGLGLYICKRIIEQHGGTIVAESKLGQGSSFVVRLPVRLDAGFAGT
jgi:signal transduction histidine kinase